MPHTSLAYRVLTSLAVPAVPVLFRDQRQHDAHRGRLGAPAQLEEWARGRRDPARPLAWFHAASVGEGLQARAVARALRAARPEIQLIYTHYSPSAVEFAATVGADWHGYLGYDRRADVDRMLAAAKPELLVFTKLDLWPELAARASARGTRVAIVAATVSPQSGRLRWPARQLAMPGYAALDAAGAIAADDADRLVLLGCRPDRIQVTGDPRVDSVLAAIDEADPEPRDPMMLVAGSTWPEDELVVLNAFERVCDRHPAARLIVAPHDPTTGRLQRVAAIARELGLPEPVRLSMVAAAESPTITMVDRVGMLARLYGRGSMAYVGGGWGSHGIHSVLEPAACSCPVVIGPNDRGSPDATLLEHAGALRRLRAPADGREFAGIWQSWLEQPDTARRSGSAGRAALESARGAARKSAAMLLAV